MGIHLVHHIRGTACVDWSYEVIVQEEGIMNYQFPKIQNIEPLELFLDLPDKILLQNQGRYLSSSKVSESDHEIDSKGFFFFFL